MKNNAVHRFQEARWELSLAARSFILALLAGIALWVTAPNSAAQPTNLSTGDPRDELIRQLLQRVEGLEGEVKAMKSAAPNNPAREVSIGSEGADHRPRFPDLTFHGFGDLNYRFSDRAGQNNAFSLGQLDLFTTSRLAENVSVLSEIVLSAGNDNKFSASVERLLLQYSANDYFNLDMGRGHTSVGYYNTAYHHGSWFQTAANRPFIFAFNGILPIHYVGLSANGRIPSGSLGLHYVTEVSNGRHYGPATDATTLSVTDDNDYKAVNAGLIARPDWAPGLQFGISAYHDWLTPAASPRIDQTIVAAHAIYKTSKLEWLNEGLLLRHEARGSAAHYTIAFYTQLAARFGPFQPYLRYEYQNAPDQDPIFSKFGVIGVRQGPSVGLRYDFTDYAAFKVQYDYIQQANRPDANDLTVQVSFTF